MPESPLEELARRIEESKRRDGSINAGIGPSGCGKTDTILRCSLAAAFIHGLKWFCYDSNGDVRVHLNGIQQSHRDGYRNAGTAAERTQHLKKLVFLETCMRDGFYSGPSELPKFLRRVLDLIAQGVKDAKGSKARKAIAIAFIDEAGAVRWENEDVWPQMRQARNAGVTIFTTGHRVKDWHPAARANLRVLALWAPATERFHDINGTRVARELCGEAKSPVVHLFTANNLQEPILWDRRIMADKYPPEIVIPAQPTVARSAGF